MISDSNIRKLIKEEFKLQTLGATEQYFEILDVYYDGDEPRIERIDRERNDGIVIVYLNVVTLMVIYMPLLKKEFVKVARIIPNPSKITEKGSTVLKRCL
ncbi:MAG TPA: hypothetical protein VKB19_12885 [Pedobacter sp.]|nr:hypothetical protein [Pedobacter sp.]